MLGKFLVAWAASVPEVAARIAGRIRPQHRHAHDLRDCLVYVLTSSSRIRSLSGETPTFRERYTLICYADRQADADTLGEEIRAGLDGYAGSLAGVEVLNAQVAEASDDEDVEADGLPPKPRRTLTLAIWYRAASP